MVMNAPQVSLKTACMIRNLRGVLHRRDKPISGNINNFIEGDNYIVSIFSVGDRKSIFKAGTEYTGIFLSLLCALCGLVINPIVHQRRIGRRSTIIKLDIKKELRNRGDPRLQEPPAGMYRLNPMRQR
jgi:hypothetical protein